MGLVCGFMLSGQRMSPAVPVKECQLPIKPSTIRHVPGGEFNWREKEDTGLKHLHGGSDGKESAFKFQSLGREDPLEKEMATHSNVLAWEISWMEEPRKLQSMGLQRVRHN